MSQTPNLNLPTWEEGNTQPDLVFNELLYVVDALLKSGVEAIQSAPPGSPILGNTYVVDPTGMGAWAGHDNAIALAVTGGWYFIVPKDQWAVRVKDEDANYRFDGATWNLDSSGGGSGVPSVNGVTGAVSIVAGAGASVSTSGSTITIGATGGGGGALPWFYYEDNGAVGDGTTDDTAAIQATIDAAAGAGGGVCAGKYGDRTYLIAGALQDTSGANAQLLLPVVDYADDPCVTIVLMGYTPPAHTFSVVGLGALPGGGTRFKSSLSSGSGSVIGGYGPSGSYAHFTNVFLKMQNMVVETVANPTISAIDASLAANFDTKDALVDPGVFAMGDITTPTTTTSFGIKCPTNGNGAHVTMTDTLVVGFYNAYEISEHSTGNNVSAMGCLVGFQFRGCDHASNFQRLLCAHVKRPLSGPSGSIRHYTHIEQIDIEHATSGPFATTQDLNDTSNLMYGDVTWHGVTAGTPGPDGSFVTAGAQNMRTKQLGLLPVVRNVSTTADTPTLDDNDAIVKFSSSSATTVTIAPETTYPWKNGTLLTFLQYGTGQVTVVAGSGVTINTPQSLKTRAQYSMISVTKVDANTFVCLGDMA